MLYINGLKPIFSWYPKCEEKNPSLVVHIHNALIKGAQYKSTVKSMYVK